MKKSIIIESQIVAAIKEQESGKKVADICRALGVHQATFYNWKKKYSGMDNQELRRLKELEEENRRLKHMYAELALDNKILKDVPCQRKDMVTYVVVSHQISISRACRVVSLPKSMYYYKKIKDDSETITNCRN